MRVRLRRASAWAAVLALAAVAVPHPAAGHPFHLQVANEVLGGTEPVDFSNWRAQSFPAPSTFWISRISVFASDVGVSDPLTISLRPDVAGFPGSGDLTQGSVDNPPGGTWVDVDLSPVIEVAYNQTYWIVARSTAPGGDGHDWWHSGNEGAYPDGKGAGSSDGASWSPRGKDFSFRVYGFLQPSFTFAVVATNSTVLPAQTTVFRVNITNAGPGSAAALWVNVSLPPELSYVTDDAAAIGGVRSGSYSFAFTNIPLAVRLFNLTARANGGVANGTTASVAFVFEATDHNGAPLARSNRNVPVAFENARLVVSIAASATLADPGDSIVLDGLVENTGRAPAAQVRIEAPVNADATYVSSVPAATYFPSNRTLLWSVASLAPGEGRGVQWTITIDPGTPDQRAIVSSVLGSCSDPSGAPLPQEVAAAVTRVQAPVFAPVLRVDRTSAERSDEVLATLYYNNSGSVASRGTWANWSLNGHYGLIGLVPALPSSPIANGFSIPWTSVPPGDHSVVARLRVIRGMIDGLSMGLQVGWTATDGNGNLLPDAVLPASVRLSAPSVELALQRGSARVEVGSLLTLNLTIRNVGAAPATGWLNLTLPPGVAYVSDNGTFVENVASGRVSWTLPSLLAASSLALEVVLRVTGSVGVVSFRASMDFTDGKGSPTGNVLSNSVPVEVVAVGGLTDAWPWWIGAAVGAVIAGVVVWRRRVSKVTVEDVFVADHNGMLLAHRSSTVVPYEDEDVVIGMFTVIQQFVRDTFSRGTGERMRAIEFGDRKVMIEQGENHYLAVVYRGRDTGRLATQMHNVSKEIDTKFRDVLTRWQGDVDSVRGITLLLPQVWAQQRGAS